MLKERKAKLIKTICDNLNVIDSSYYRKLSRIEKLSKTISKYTLPDDDILDLGSGAFILECILEDIGYKHLTAVDCDSRLGSYHQQLKNNELLKYTMFYEQAITEYRSSQLYNFIILYDCVYYPSNNIVSMLPQLDGLLKGGGYLFFDVYDESVHKVIKLIYNLVRKKYRNRTMYSLEKLNYALKEQGFEIIEVNIELGPKNVFIKSILYAIYILTGKALVVNYLARKGNTDV